jgi:hypothetical protein
LFVVFLLDLAALEMWDPAGIFRLVMPGTSAPWATAFGHTRVERKLTQEDMISYGFSVRHWQMIEAGRPITVFTMLRVCEAISVPPDELLAGLNHHLRKRRTERFPGRAETPPPE